MSRLYHDDGELLSEADPSISVSLLTPQSPRPPHESEPLLGHRPARPWYRRASPFFIVPLALTASLCRGVTIAPRVEIYTQLACDALRPIHTILIPPPPLLYPTLLNEPTGASPHNQSPAVYFEPAPAKYPINDCAKDPAVQAGAAELQAAMTSIMGILSALTTGWWGTFGDKHGRTRVMALVILGLCLTDVIFVVTVNYWKQLYGGHKFIILGPILEGLLGSWAAWGAAVNAYLSDCTDQGSRAKIFSRFAGLYYTGVALGPTLGAFILQKTSQTVDIFYFSIGAFALCLLFVVLILPESLTTEARLALADRRQVKKIQRHERRATAFEEAGAQDAIDESLWGFLGGRQLAFRLRRAGKRSAHFLSPVRLFLPYHKPGGGSDWSLTILSLALFGFYLTVGVYQNKYLYGEHVYGWGAVELGYFITFLSSTKAICTLVLLPAAIWLFKPKSVESTSETETSANAPLSLEARRSRLASDIKFDLLVARCSVFLDTTSFILVCLTSDIVPFILASGLSSLGSGSVPSMQSLALCLLPNPQEDTGRMFGGIAVMQAIGSTILGPMLFGIIYAKTVAVFPKAIFAVGGGILVFSLSLLLLVRPLSVAKSAPDVERTVPTTTERPRRGRRTTGKDLRPSI